jgi:hypothetical protein
MKLGRRLSPLLLIFFALFGRQTLAAAPLTPAADDSAARREAADHFARGVAHADAGAWHEAAAEFQAAYSAVPHFSVLYNLGQSYQAIDRPVDALDAFERYLNDGGREVPPPRRARVEGHVATLRGRVATLHLSAAPADARLAIDGREVRRSEADGAPSLVRLLPGTHTISASRDGHEPREQRVQLQAGQTFILEMTLVPVRAVTAVGTVDPPGSSLVVTSGPAAREQAPKDRRMLGYGLGATAVALAGTAVGIYLWNDGRYAKWDSKDKDLAAQVEAGTFSSTFEQDQRDNNELWQSVERVDWITRGLLAGAAVSGTLAAILILRRPKGPAEQRAASIIPAPGGAVVFLEIGW